MKSQSPSTEPVFTYATPSGLVIERTRELLADHDPALQTLRRALDQRRGLLLACTFEYPGRYRKRELGFCDPPLVLESRGAEFALTALNARGELLLRGLTPALSDSPDFGLHART